MSPTHPLQNQAAPAKSSDDGHYVRQSPSGASTQLKSISSCRLLLELLGNLFKGLRYATFLMFFRSWITFNLN
jgi:hypothetical protein